MAVVVIGEELARGGATFSDDRTHRYSLTRKVSDLPGALVVIGMNPSTADAAKNDQTIRRCMHYATAERLGMLVMLNLWSLRATRLTEWDARFLKTEETDAVLFTALRVWAQSSFVVAAWGAVAGDRFRDRIDVVRHLARRAGAGQLWSWGKTVNGSPRHPSRLANDVPLERWP